MNQASALKVAELNQASALKLAELNTAAALKVAELNLAAALKLAELNWAPALKVAELNQAAALKVAALNKAAELKVAESNQAAELKVAESNPAAALNTIFSHTTVWEKMVFEKLIPVEGGGIFCALPIRFDFLALYLAQTSSCISGQARSSATSICEVIAAASCSSSDNACPAQAFHARRFFSCKSRSIVSPSCSP
ncbi:MAG: hypothetical protein ABJO27_06355 [Pseudoruegeria sp.]